MNLSLPRLLVIELVVIATGVILWFAGSLIAELASVALVLALAILVTYALLPAVDFLAQYKYCPRWLAVLLVYLALLVAVGGVVAIVSVPLAKQVEELARNYPTYVDRAQDLVPSWQHELDSRNIKLNLQEQISQLGHNLQSLASNVASKTGDIIASIFGTVSTTVLVLFVTLYFLIDGRNIAESLIKYFPSRRQRMVRRLGRDYDRILGSYVRGQLLISFFIFVAVSIFCAILGLPYFVILGLVSGVMSLIPTVGTAISMTVPAAVAAFVNPILVPVFIVFFLVLNEISDKVLYPRIVGKAVALHPLAVFFAFLVGVQIAGIAGALLATPILALLKVTIISLGKTQGYAR